MIERYETGEHSNQMKMGQCEVNNFSDKNYVAVSFTIVYMCLLYSTVTYILIYLGAYVYLPAYLPTYLPN
jgi:hypothetical protein